MLAIRVASSLFNDINKEVHLEVNLDALYDSIAYQIFEKFLQLDSGIKMKIVDSNCLKLTI